MNVFTLKKVKNDLPTVGQVSHFSCEYLPLYTSLKFTFGHKIYTSSFVLEIDY